MEKNIELTLEQQDELINVSMTSFKGASLNQSIKDTNKWWIANFLPNAIIQRIDRIGALTYKIVYYNDYVDESESSIFGSVSDYNYFADVAKSREKSGFGMTSN